MSKYTLDAAQRQYLLTRITAIEADLINLVGLSIYADKRKMAIAKLTQLPAATLIDELATLLGYYENPNVVMPRTATSDIVNSVNAVFNNPATGVLGRQKAIRAEGARLRDCVMVGTLEDNPATLLHKFTEFKTS